MVKLRYRRGKAWARLRRVSRAGILGLQGSSMVLVGGKAVEAIRAGEDYSANWRASSRESLAQVKVVGTDSSRADMAAIHSNKAMVEGILNKATAEATALNRAMVAA